MTTPKIIIGLVGLQGAGKDTVADYLQTIHGFKRDSFASTLKDSVSCIFGWNRELLEGRTTESRKWREQVDQWWSEKLNMPHLTPRWVLQYFGTEVCRKGFDDNIWVASLERKLSYTDDNIVISDVRFLNEILAIRNAGGTVIRVKRGPEPVWYADAVNYNAGKKRVGWALGRDALEKHGVHPSEYSWIGTDFDYVVENHGTFDDLFEQVSDLLQDLRNARVSLAA